MRVFSGTLAITALLLLAACASTPGLGRSDANAEASVIPAAVHLTGPWAPPPVNDTLVALDGAKLPMRVWLPDGPVKAVIVAVHGFNDYSNAFTVPAKDWAKHGIATYAYDQRGFGEAPSRGLWVGRRVLDEDLVAASRMARAKHPGVPIYLLGESMGGAVVISTVTREAGTPKPEADGVILSAPAVWGRETMNIAERAALWTMMRIAPHMTLTGSGLKIWPSDNIEMLRTLGRDPLVIKETRVDAVNGLVDLMSAALNAAPRLDVPMLMLYGEQDQLVPKAPTQLMISRLPADGAATRRIAWYPKGYHMLLRDLEAKVVLHDIDAWIVDHKAPLPSSADLNASRILFSAS